MCFRIGAPTKQNLDTSSGIRSFQSFDEAPRAFYVGDPPWGVGEFIAQRQSQREMPRQLIILDKIL